MSQKWIVQLSRDAEKKYNKLKRNGSKPSITDVINLLIIEIRKEGPYRNNWSNYGPLEEDAFHCHLKREHPLLWHVGKLLIKRIN